MIFSILLLISLLIVYVFSFLILVSKLFVNSSSNILIKKSTNEFLFFPVILSGHLKIKFLLFKKLLYALSKVSSIFKK